MIPSFLYYGKLTDKLRSLSLFQKVAADPSDLDFWWFSRGPRPFSLYRFFTHYPENFRYDVDFVAGEEEEDYRENILASLAWYDEETFFSDVSDEADEESFFHDEDNPIGYHNLSPAQLEWDMLSHLEDMESELLVMQERFQKNRPIPKAFFSIPVGSITGLDDTSLVGELYDTYDLSWEQVDPPYEVWDDEINSEVLEFEDIDFENDVFPDVWDEDFDDQPQMLSLYEDQLLTFWLSSQQFVTLLPFNHLLTNALQNSFFRKAAFLKHSYIGLDALSHKNHNLSWNYFPLLKQPYLRHLSQPRVFFRTWIMKHFEEFEEDLLVDNNRFFSHELPPDLLPYFSPSYSAKKASAIKRKRLPAELVSYHETTGGIELDSRYMDLPDIRGDSDADEDDFFEDHIFFLHTPKENNPLLHKMSAQRRNRYAPFFHWRKGFEIEPHGLYALLTAPNILGRYFNNNRWRFSFKFNSYFLEKTLNWYLQHFTLVPFKENILMAEEEHTLFLDTEYFTKWREGTFYEVSLSSFWHTFVNWHSYLLNLMNRSMPKHPFHIVTPSPWPLLTAFGALLLTTGGVLYMHTFKLGGLTLFLGFIYLVGTVTLWWRDVIREASFLGNHTPAVQTNLKIGVALFIVSEVMFFFAFFWAFFHSSLSPAIDVGSVWPPLGITPISPYGIPLFNSFILALSGYTVTYAHHAMLEGERNYVFYGLIFTLILAFLFSFLQFIEYKTLPFLLSDGIYGSTFFMTTGFHALHVIIGSTFLLVCLFRLSQFTKTHHIGFEAAIWYWHFVDVVWLFLWLSIYWWPSLQ